MYAYYIEYISYGRLYYNNLEILLIINLYAMCIDKCVTLEVVKETW